MKGRKKAPSAPSQRKLAAAAAGGALGGARVAAVAARRGAAMMGPVPGAVAQQRATNAQQLIDRVKIRRQVQANRTSRMRTGLP